MARPGFIDGADDMLIDMEKLDAANRGKVTPYVADSIRSMAKRGLPVDLISQQTLISIADVERVLASGKDQPLIP